MTKSVDIGGPLADMSWMAKLSDEEWTSFKKRYKEFQHLNIELAKELMEELS